MKKLLLGAVALTMLATACKKSDDGGTSNTWKVGSSSYTATTVAGNGNGGAYGVTASSGTDGITFTFNGAAAPASGSYKVVKALIPAAGQVSFIANKGTTDFYTPTGNDNISATVTNNGGKITVNMPNAWAKTSSSATDSVQVSANLTQQ